MLTPSTANPAFVCLFRYDEIPTLGAKLERVNFLTTCTFYESCDLVYED